MRRVLSVYLPSWPTDRLRIKDRALAPDTPLVTLRREGTKRILASVDARGQKLGLYPGQTLAYARMILPEFTVRDMDTAQDWQGLQTIALACLKSYSPLVAIADARTFWMDIAGCAHLFGNEQALAEDLAKRLKDKNIHAHIAVADTAGSAYALSFTGTQKIVIVPPGKHKEWIADLSIGALRLRDENIEGLKKLGFTRIKQLYDTPRAPLVRRFGKDIMRRLDQALGLLNEPLEPMSAPEISQVKCSFTEPAANPPYIALAIEELCVQLCHKLIAQKLGARRLDLIFHRVDNTKQALRVGTVRASHEPKHYMRLLREHFDKVDYGFGIEALSLSAPLVEVFLSEQYINALADAPRIDLSSLIDVLQNRLGRAQVYQTKAIESDVPERSVKRIAPLSQKNDGLWPTDLPRPTRLLKQPERVDAMALLPDHAPRQFVWRQKNYHVKHADGPERIFGEWWNGREEFMSVRDYFQVEDDTGARFWLFRRGDGQDPRTGSHAWFIHGFFG